MVARKVGAQATMSTRWSRPCMRGRVGSFTSWTMHEGEALCNSGADQAFKRQGAGQSPDPLPHRIDPVSGFFKAGVVLWIPLCCRSCLLAGSAARLALCEAGGSTSTHTNLT